MRKQFKFFVKGNHFFCEEYLVDGNDVNLLGIYDFYEKDYLLRGNGCRALRVKQGVNGIIVDDDVYFDADDFGPNSVFDVNKIDNENVIVDTDDFVDVYTILKGE